MEKEKIIDFFFELGALRHIPRSGWSLIGVKPCESVAEHSLRAAQIGFVLGKMEGVDNPPEISSILIFHDIGETRVGDIHRIAKAYVQAAEEAAVSDQVASLGGIGQDILELWRAHAERRGTVGRLALDADLIEVCLSAREYMKQGYPEAKRWIDNAKRLIQSTSAKMLVDQLEELSPHRWWDELNRT